MKQSAKTPWISVSSHGLNWGWRRTELDEMGSEVLKGKTVGGIGLREIALITIGAGILIKVALPFARGLLGF